MNGLIFVIIGGFFEPAWVIALEKAGGSEGRRRVMWYIAFLVFTFFSLYFLSLGMGTLSLGIAYAIWTAIGSIVTIISSRLLFKENINAGKIFAVMLILIGISGLELLGGSS
jgi:multidrug transporter EmrE-like cation transporter